MKNKTNKLKTRRVPRTRRINKNAKGLNSL